MNSNHKPGTNVMNELICGLNTSQVQLANYLYACGEEFPADMIDWQMTKNPGISVFCHISGNLGILVVLSNLSIIVGVLKEKKLRKQQHLIQCVCQALTDLVVGLLVSIYYNYILVNGGIFLGKQLGCNIFGVGIVGTCHTTVFSLSWIAYNRKIRVIDNKQVSTGVMLKWYAFGVWGMTFGLLIFYAAFADVRMLSSGAFCNPIYTLPILLVAGTFVMVPICYVIFAYYKVHKVMNSTSKAVQHKPLSAGAKKGRWFTTIKSIKGSPRPQSSSQKQQVRATRLMIAMSASILILWIPLYI